MENTPENRPAYTHDLIFSMCIQEESVLSLINAAFFDDGRKLVAAIKDLTVQDAFQMLQEGSGGSRLDVTADMGDGRWINVEIQMSRRKDMLKRSLFSASQFLARAKASGVNNYNLLPDITIINFLDFVIRKNDPGFHQPIALMYKNGARESVGDLLCIHNVEMPKARELELDKNNPLQRWIYFFDNGYKKPDDPLVREVIEMDSGIKRFEEEYNSRVNDPEVIRKLLDLERMRMDRTSQEAERFNEGLEQGKREMLISMFQSGMNPSQIKLAAQAAGISSEVYNQVKARYRP